MAPCSLTPQSYLFLSQVSIRFVSAPTKKRFLTSKKLN